MTKAADLAKFIGNNEQNMKLLLNATISSAVDQYDIDSTHINSTYDTYKVIGRVVLANDNENLFMRFFSSGSILDGSVYAREASKLPEKIAPK